MRRFIKLTNSSTGTALLVDVRIIRSILQIGDKCTEARTRIVTDREDLYVTEAYYTVMKRMEEVFNKEDH